MSHHFSSPAMKADRRLNLTDAFVFPAADRQHTVFVLNVGPDAGAGKSTPERFHTDAVYIVNIDTDGDVQADLRLVARFRADAGGQRFDLLRQRGAAAAASALDLAAVLAHDVPLATAAPLQGGGRVWAGLAGDPFVANVAGYFAFMETVAQGRPDYSVFATPNNKFDGRDVLSLVIELPNAQLPCTAADGAIRVWTSIEAAAHGEMHQLCRWGLPLAVFVQALAPAHHDEFNAQPPHVAVATVRARAEQRLTQILAASASADDPQALAARLAQRWVPAVLPYRIGSGAYFAHGGINGRGLRDNAFDVVLTQIVNRPLSAGIDPAPARPEFPYVPAAGRRADIAAVIDRGSAPA
jgi:hypothetical protein